MRNILLWLCIGAVLVAPIGGQDAFVKEWEKNYSTDERQEIIQCMSLGDLNNDGVFEIILGVNLRPQAGLQSYAVQILDDKGTKKQKWDSTYRINDIFVTDLDNDGVSEILVSGADLFVLSNTAKNLNYPLVGTVVSAAVADDLDDDGRKEILVGTREVICMGETVNWTVPIGTQVKKIVVSDVNWDGSPEVVVLTSQNVHVFNMDGDRLWISPGGQNLRDMAVANIDGDNPVEILYSTDNELILAWEAREDGIEWEINLGTYMADFLAVDDLNKDGTPEIVIGTSKLRLEILDFEGKILWQYRFEAVESQDAFIGMIVEDLDGDTWNDILLAHSVNSMAGGLDGFLYFMKNQWKPPPPSAGHEYFTQALEKYNEGEYTEALTLFAQAQTAFLEEGDQDMADQCQDYIDQTQRLGKLAEVDAKIIQAETLVDQGAYEKAIDVYEEVKTLYEELGDSENVQECIQRIAEIEDMKAPVTVEPVPVEENGSRGLFLPLLLLVGILIVGGYIVVNRYRGAPKVRVTGEVEKVKEEKVRKVEKPVKAKEAEIEEEIEEIEEEEEEIEEEEEEIEEEEEEEEIEEEEKPPPKRDREEERKLKAQFVYGEINKEEYREKLRNLYEDED
jgi:hypothetical protein